MKKHELEVGMRILDYQKDIRTITKVNKLDYHYISKRHKLDNFIGNFEFLDLCEILENPNSLEEGHIE